MLFVSPELEPESVAADDTLSDELALSSAFFVVVSLLLVPAVGVVFLADAASFLAQPLPLKWMAGGLRTLLIVPPQAAQVSGP